MQGRKPCEDRRLHAEAGVTHLQTRDARDHWKLAEARKTEGEFLPRDFRGSTALPTL